MDKEDTPKQFRLNKIKLLICDLAHAQDPTLY